MAAYLGFYTSGTLLVLLSQTPDLLLEADFCVSVRPKIESRKNTNHLILLHVHFSHAALSHTEINALYFKRAFHPKTSKNFINK